MDNGLQKCLDKLTEALQHTRESDIARIRACVDFYRVEGDPHEYEKEVAEIEYESGCKVYVDIGCGSNLAAIYDIVSVLLRKKRPSDLIQRIVYDDPDMEGDERR